MPYYPPSIVDPAYVGQTTITTLGTIATGTWQGTVVGAQYGGTGVNNSTRTLTIATNGGTLDFNASSSTLTIPATGTAALLATANVFSATQEIDKNGITGTSTDGAILANTTAATVGVQQFSPRLRLTGQGWKTNATAGSQTVDWIIENQPVQGTANPTANLIIKSQINAAGYNTRMTLSDAGTLSIGSFAQMVSGGTYAQITAQAATNGLWLTGGAAGAIVVKSDSSAVDYVGMGSTSYLAFTALSGNGYGTPDVGLARNAAGILEIDDGSNTRGRWGALKAGTRDAGTTTIVDGLTLGHQISSGTPGVGLGIGIQLNINSSTTADQNAARITAEWVVATHASRTARGIWNVYDTASREAIRVEASGSAAMIGFLGAVASVRQASGANVTNNVTSGGTDDTIANFTDLTVYANDAAAIRNDIYQLARKQKQMNDALRLYGLLT